MSETAKISFLRLKAGPWGPRSHTELTPGSRVEAQRKDGTMKPITVGRSVAQRPPDWWLYEIVADEANSTADKADPTAVEEWAKPAGGGSSSNVMNTPDKSVKEDQAESRPTFIKLVASAEDGLRSSRELKSCAEVEVLREDGTRQTVIVGKLRATNRRDEWIYEAVAARSAVPRAPNRAARTKRAGKGGAVSARPSTTKSTERRSTASQTSRDGTVRYHWLKRDKKWGLVAPRRLSPGKMAEVQKADGTTDTVVVGKELWTNGRDAWVYEIVRDQQPEADSPRAAAAYHAGMVEISRNLRLLEKALDARYCRHLRAMRRQLWHLP